LRNILTSWGVPKEEIGDFRTLKLLDRVLQSALAANESGLSIVEQSDSIQKCYREKRAALNMDVVYDRVGELLEESAKVIFRSLNE
jgi:hypothetical protein